jgi:leucyl-tRNA synthetase
MSESTIPRYEPHAIEASRQAAWRARSAFATPAIDGDRPRRYIKPSAPFTSGNIHIGHVRSYSIGDAYARFVRSQGEDVLFAFGFDAFGLPAELVAIDRGEPPADWVERCAAHMKGQLERLGYSFDWDRAFMSSDAQMYRWSQWLFLKLLAAGLVYEGTGAVDWCDTCQTTLATIQVEAGGLCWRCHQPVRLIKRSQWNLKLSAYVEENDARLAELSDSGIWDEVALASQRFVLGRVDGFEADLEAPDGTALTVFFSDPADLEDAQFVLISPKHPDVERWIADPDARARLEDLRAEGLARDERDAEAIPLLDTGLTLLAPRGDGENGDGGGSGGGGDGRGGGDRGDGSRGEPLPVLVSPVVDGRYGTTAVLGVPARDRTDAAIARRLGLEVPEGADDGSQNGDARARAYAPSENDIAAFENDPGSDPSFVAGLAPRAAVRYRAGDFSISRQRSWGTPIPIVRCERCGTVPVPDEQLPVLLPRDLTPTGQGNPLAERQDFVNTDCPGCGGPAKRETDTLDCHFDALWLWVPVCVPPGERDRPLDQIFGLEDLRAWLPCERVVAGSDSGNFVFDQRIVTKALRELGPLEFLGDGEPFAGCLFHEMVIADGRKMSKHLGNVVDPDELIERYGADTVRLATLYAARPQRTLNWSDSAVLRCHRFLNQVFDFTQSHIAAAATITTDETAAGAKNGAVDGAGADAGAADGAIQGAGETTGAGVGPKRDKTEHLRVKLEKWCDAAVERVTEEMTGLEMHLAVRDVMRLFDRVKDFEKRVLAKTETVGQADRQALLAALGVLAQLLAPLAPHVAEELWVGLGNDGTTQTPWPSVSSVVPV